MRRTLCHLCLTDAWKQVETKCVHTRVVVVVVVVDSRLSTYMLALLSSAHVYYNS